MTTILRIFSKKIFAICLALGSSFMLSGCIIALPSALKFASFALDGFSLAATGKTTTDHLISKVIDQDCSMSRALKNEDVCTPNKVDVPMDKEINPSEPVEAKALSTL